MTEKLLRTVALCRRLGSTPRRLLIHPKDAESWILEINEGAPVDLEAAISPYGLCGLVAGVPVYVDDDAIEGEPGVAL